MRTEKFKIHFESIGDLTFKLISDLDVFVDVDPTPNRLTEADFLKTSNNLAARSEIKEHAILDQSVLVQ